MSRANTCALETCLPSHASTYLSQLGSHLSSDGPPSLRQAFRANADLVTAQTMAHDLEAALRREVEQAALLRSKLELVVAERDRLRAELAGCGSVFELDEGLEGELLL